LRSAGLGAIGRKVARELTTGFRACALSAIATGNKAKAQAWLDREAIACPIISSTNCRSIPTSRSNARRRGSSRHLPADAQRGKQVMV